MSSTTIAARIKLARKMAGLDTQAQLLERIPEWKPSRLGNYEAGVSSPNAEETMRIAKATGASPCWLMFGHGPIRSSERDQQAIRHQNLSHIVEEKIAKRGGTTRLAKALGIDKTLLLEHHENPFLPIPDELARAFESACKEAPGWMDEQHIEHDPLFASFPEDLREVLMIYSAASEEKRAQMLRVMRAL